MCVSRQKTRAEPPLLLCRRNRDHCNLTPLTPTLNAPLPPLPCPSQVWERAWTLSEMRATATKWSLGADQGLLHYLEEVRSCRAPFPYSAGHGRRVTPGAAALARPLPPHGLAQRSPLSCPPAPVVFKAHAGADDGNRKGCRQPRHGDQALARPGQQRPQRVSHAVRHTGACRRPGGRGWGLGGLVVVSFAVLGGLLRSRSLAVVPLALRCLCLPLRQRFFHPHPSSSSLRIACTRTTRT